MFEKPINIVIPKGVFCCIAGPNGIGKTVLYRAILNNINYEGQILINGYQNTKKVAKENIAYVPTNFIDIKLTAYQFLFEMSLISGIKKNIIDNRIAELCRDFKINSLILKNKMCNLSSGNNKIILLMQAFLNSANLLILDEPTENLDYKQKYIFYQYLANVRQKNKDMSVLISSHNLDEVSNHINCALFLKSIKGTFVKEITGKEFVHTYKELYE